MIPSRTLCAFLLLVSTVLIRAADDELLTLPIRFHITHGAVMMLKEQKMEVWIKPEDLQGPVLTEVNRIWKQANIQFVIERIQDEPLLSPPNRDHLLRSVENANRSDDESAGPTLTANINKLLDPAERHPTAHNIYLLPFIGSTSQGYAKLGGNHIVVGVWTDKPSKGEEAPVKTLLVEPEPMKVGSLARTIAHELGHNLGLNHPPKSVLGTIGRLMGGKVQGYELTSEEIVKARTIAKRNLDAAATQK